MGIAQSLTGWVIGRQQSVADCEAEIREELEFHLEMRALDNEAAGMSSEDAREDARQRFGDFERQYQACRQVALGIPLALRRLQVLLVIGLLVAVASLGWALVRAQNTQTQYEMQLAELRDQLKASQSPLLSPASETNCIPFVQWNPSLMLPSRAEPQDALVSEICSDFVPNTLDQPWSDWSVLAESPLPVIERP